MFAKIASSHVFGWINLFAGMDIYWMLLHSGKPDGVPWNTGTGGNKSTVKSQSMKSLYLLFLRDFEKHHSALQPAYQPPQNKQVAPKLVSWIQK